MVERRPASRCYESQPWTRDVSAQRLEQRDALGFQNEFSDDVPEPLLMTLL